MTEYEKYRGNATPTDTTGKIHGGRLRFGTRSSRDTSTIEGDWWKEKDWA